MLAVAMVIKPLVYYRFGLYRRVWAYASVQELRLIILAVTTASLLLAVGIILLWPLGIFRGPIFYAFPRSVLAIDWLLSLLAVGGLRFSLRMISESRRSVIGVTGRRRRVLIAGAGDAGALVVREMQKNPQLNLDPVCFVDDDPGKRGKQIHDVPVAGTLTELGQVLESKSIEEVIIALPSAPGAVVRQVADICRLKGVPFRTIPGIYDLIGGKVNVSRLREVDITDLLRREPAAIDDRLIGQSLGGKRILVTGAGGSIGSELCRQIIRWQPAELIMVGHGENTIFETYVELQELVQGFPLHPVIADIRDRQRLQTIFEHYRPEVVFHTAAHKHVVLMELNPEEAVTNNVLGTRNVVEMALENGVDRLVMVSTDKAIRPSSVMGATKRLAEMVVLDAARRSARAYSVVRFGNVLGSRGSVVPRFKRQIARGGPVTITHPEMERFFMTIPEAVHLVLQAAAMGVGGEVFVLNMGEQVKILDLAKDLIRLSGLEPGRDIEIVFTGIRPGEKLSESLWDEGSGNRPTDHPDIMRLIRDEHINSNHLLRSVDELIRLAAEGDNQAICTLLDELIPGAAVRSAPPPDLTSVV